MTPARGKVLVRKVETSESYAGGKIVLPEAVREQIAAQQVEIVKIGPWAACEDGDCERMHFFEGGDGIAGYAEVATHPFSVEPGSWCLIAPRSLVESGIPDTYLVAQDSVLAILSLD